MRFPNITRPVPKAGFTVMELTVAVAIVIVLASISISVVINTRQAAHLTRVNQKIKNLGEAFVDYTSDNNGYLPYEDAPGSDGWAGVRDEDAAEAWYNALPTRMGAPSVADLADQPEAFYSEGYPLTVPGAAYPKGEKKFKKPYFAIAMNSRLQRKGDDGYKDQEVISTIQDPVRTVVFLERGLPDDKKVSKAQRGFNGKPKANPRAFAARHNQKGVLLFFDGHTEVRAVSELIDRTGRIHYPQDRVVWTIDPRDDPN